MAGLLTARGNHCETGKLFNFTGLSTGFYLSDYFGVQQRKMSISDLHRKPRVAIMQTSNLSCDDKVGIMITPVFQCSHTGIRRTRVQKHSTNRGQVNAYLAIFTELLNAIKHIFTPYVWFFLEILKTNTPGPPATGEMWCACWKVRSSSYIHQGRVLSNIM